MKSRSLWINLAAMALTAGLLVTGTLFWLDYYTRHGKEVQVPPVKNTMQAAATARLEAEGLKAMVLDTGYIASLPAGMILEQSIAAGTMVKEGRTIYLTVNSGHSPTIPLPDLADNSSLREAVSRLRAVGFIVTEPEYIAGEDQWVYQVKVNGRSVPAGTRVPTTARITLVVGNGSEDMTDSISDVMPLPEDIFDTPVENAEAEQPRTSTTRKTNNKSSDLAPEYEF